MIKEATFPDAEMQVIVEMNRQQFLVNSSKVDVMARKEFSRVLFGENHPCGRHAILEDYDFLTTNHLKEFYQQYYHSGNCSIYLSGYITDTIVSKVAEEFGSSSWGNVTTHDL